MASKAEIASHEINRTVSNVLELLASERAANQIGGLDAPSKTGLQRIEIFVRQLREQINASSDIDISLNGLNAIQSNLQNTWNELNAFVSNGQSAHIVNAQANLDGAISSASWVFFRKPSKGSRVYGETIGTVELQADVAIKKVADRTEEISIQLQQISEQATSHLQTVDAAAASASEARDEIRLKLKQLDNQFDQLANGAEKKVAEATENLEKTANDFLVEKEEDSRSLLERLKELETQAKNIVQVIGNVGVTGNYQNRSQLEGVQANFWRWITISLFAIGVILVVVNIILNFSGEIDLDLLLARFAIAVSVALPAIYTARESARHRTNADRAKQTELELASLGPFLQNLPDEQREQIIASLAPIYFGRLVEDHKVESPVDVGKLIDALANVATSKLPK